MQKTLSITIGKGSIGHNNRDFYADNIDSNRSQNNIIFHKENIKKVYRELFGTALAEYNAKQKRKDRIIKDYRNMLNTLLLWSLRQRRNPASATKCKNRRMSLKWLH